MDIWVGTKYFIFCSGYKAPTSFQNLQIGFLTCRERDTRKTPNLLKTLVYNQDLDFQRHMLLSYFCVCSVS